jgi:hypothetical protein
MSDHAEHDGYEAPKLTEFGTIEEWTKGPCSNLICISIILP